MTCLGTSNWTRIEYFRSVYSRNQESELHEGLRPEVKTKNTAEARGYGAGLWVVGYAKSTVQAS